MTAFRRFLRWLADSLPVYSNRRVAQAWLDGLELGRRQMGLARDARGRFKRVSPNL